MTVKIQIPKLQSDAISSQETNQIFSTIMQSYKLIQREDVHTQKDKCPIMFCICTKNDTIWGWEIAHQVNHLPYTCEDGRSNSHNPSRRCG